MAIERSLSIIKPEAVERGVIGEILRQIEGAGLRVVAAKLLLLDTTKARAFYAVHKDRPFYSSLTKYISSGPIFVSVLEGDNAISRNREIMGATDPSKAAEGTVRRQWGSDVEKNAVHGSDGPDTAAWEISFFFQPEEIHGINK
ncbi:MAG: nucleoside-diphosphate kinase [Candidatus Binatia bacterium]